ncbi:hypothetical protein [Mucilaginibacter segetis]|uniref:Uncharacterized protein n=1 Tax=Mucilaginibacter segetis TaxID=2793071 RepID=A0A934ULM6_9SPHI|nr:hypothetical protein [Mucilaginibacter segetis]MBK0378743.1 hypothetical protein [Mucilaginibacter segetis]
MKTIDLSQPGINNLFRRADGDRHNISATSSYNKVFGYNKQSNTQEANAQIVKKAVRYVIDAVGEGIKQNLLGYDINIDFLTLTLRSYLYTGAKSAKYFVTKHLPAASTANNNLSE